jgi:hypothetical protein
MSIKKIAVVGAGIFGCSIALELDKEGYIVSLFEKEADIMLVATKNNHNRIHYGYHYPRSLDTARQSLEGLLSFTANYGASINYNFKNFYSIAKYNSLTSPSQFEGFCKKVGIGYKLQTPPEELMNQELIEKTYLVEEPVFDWDKLQYIVKDRLKNSSVDLRLESNFIESTENFDFIVNCTYSNLNEICDQKNLQGLNFKKQDVLVPIFKSSIPRTGLTVMDGPFCSVMPRGFRDGEFLLYHAKFSIVEEVTTSELKLKIDLAEKIKRITDDSERYFPFLKNAEIIDYWRTCRAIPINNNDQRLSEIITYADNPNFITVFSGKVSTAVRISKQISLGLKTGNFNSHVMV